MVVVKNKKISKSKKLGRPTEVNQEKIIKIARTLFAEHGYEAASTRMIAQKADCNVAMIGYYFGSKEGLLDHIIKSYFQEATKVYSYFHEYNEDLSEEFTEFQDPEVRQFCKALYEFSLFAYSHREIHQIIIRDAMSGGKLMLNALAKNEYGVIPLIHKKLRSLVISKKLPLSTDIEMTGITLVSTIINACISSTCLSRVHNIDKIDHVFFHRLSVHQMRHLFKLV